jgi:hypothetical protein
MTQVGGTTKRESTPQTLPSQEVPEQSGLKTLVSLTKILLRNPAAFRKLRVMGPDEERFVRPPRQYEVPPFRKDMQYCTSNEQYLRPTRWCNPREHEVVAMANELGAYELPDDEFAEAAYWFVKTKMRYEICPFDSAGATLKRGSGMCYHLINAFIVLCRAAGIKARYKQYQMRFRGIEQEFFTDVDPAMKALWEAAGGVVTEAEAEARINGKWETAYLAQIATTTGATGWPITEFGESSLGLYFDALPGSIKRFEGISLMFGVSLKLMNWLAPASTERMNVRIAEAQLLGQREIEEAGGIRAYNEMAKRKRELYSADEILNQQLLKHYDKYNKIVVKKK